MVHKQQNFPELTIVTVYLNQTPLNGDGDKSVRFNSVLKYSKHRITKQYITYEMLWVLATLVKKYCWVLDRWLIKWKVHHRPDMFHQELVFLTTYCLFLFYFVMFDIGSHSVPEASGLTMQPRMASGLQGLRPQLHKWWQPLRQLRGIMPGSETS